MVQLTERQTAILVLLAKGRNSEEIADAFCVSPTTVQRGVDDILYHTKARNRTHAVALALRHGMIEFPKDTYEDS